MKNATLTELENFNLTTHGAAGPMIEFVFKLI